MGATTRRKTALTGVPDPRAEAFPGIQPGESVEAWRERTTGFKPWQMNLGNKPGETNWGAFIRNFGGDWMQGLADSYAAVPGFRQLVGVKESLNSKPGEQLPTTGTMVFGKPKPAVTPPAPGTPVGGGYFTPLGQDWSGGPNPSPGQPPGAAGYIFGPESGALGQRAQNPVSSAAGSGQFLNDTWNDKDLKKRAGYGDVPDMVWMALRTSNNAEGVKANIAMTNAYAQRNSEQWTKVMGTQPTPGDVYGMHFLDGPGYIKLVQTARTNPGAIAASMFPAAAGSNPSIFYDGSRPRTVAEVQQVLSSKVRGGPWAMPQLQQLDGAQLAGMIPMPEKPAYLDLPNAPQRQANPARPQLEQIDIPSIMAQFEQFKPKPFDEQQAAKDQRLAVLAGLAQGAASGDPRQGLGAMLAAIGAGGSTANYTVKKQTEAERKTADEAQRLFGLSNAEMSVNLGEKNRETRNTNAQFGWQDQADKLETDFLNQKNQFDVSMQEAVANNQIDRQYLQDVYQAKVLKARTQIEASQFNTQLANQSAMGQQELDLKQYLYDDDKRMKFATEGLVNQATALASSVGINPQMAIRDKDQVGMNAWQGAAYIASGNTTAAINALGREMVLTGQLDQIADPTVKAQIQRLMQQDPSGDLAAAALGRLLNDTERQNPGAVLEWAKALSSNGAPFATLFVQRAKPLKAAKPGPAKPPASAVTLSGGPPEDMGLGE